MNRWYVVYTQANNEMKALSNLLRQGFSAYVPQIKKLRRHARKTESVLRPLFPRYLFVSMDLSQQRWRSILSTYGVSSLVGNDRGPEAVPQGLVEAIQARESDAGAVHPLRLRGVSPGEHVRIESGAFADQLATLKDLDDNDRVTVLMNLLGREVTVRLPLETVSVP